MLVYGIAAARAGDHAEARRYLERVLFNDATRDQINKAHLWLSRITSDPAEQREHLEEVLAADPTHAEAQRALAILDGRLDPAEVVDPDELNRGRIAPEAAAPQATNAQRLICPMCAGRVRFQPGKLWVQCHYCGHRQPLQAAWRGGSELKEHDFIATLATAKGHVLPAGTRTYRCEGCQAILLTTGTLSTHCPYCGSAHLLEDHTPSTIAPAGIIPFELDEAAAAASLRSWMDRELGKRAADARKTRPRGLYLPIWTFDLIGEIGWRIVEPDRYSRGPAPAYAGARAPAAAAFQQDGHNRIRDGSDYVILDDLVVPATHKVPYGISAVFRSFDLDLAAPYNPDYLTDWPAELYEISVSDASLVARRQARDQAGERIRHLETDGAVFSPQDVQVFSRSLGVQAYKLILVPIYLAHYRYQGDAYAVVLNGQNGQAFGEMPQRGLGRLFNRWRQP
jgi:DNA-directed RNA polymerase subunit RPC12/RpoP